MNMKQVAELFGIKESNSKAMKNRTKAREIMSQILRCGKCGELMSWVEGTNVCTCNNCTYTSVVNGEKKTFNTFKTINGRNFRFLTNNYSVLEEEV